MIDDEWAVLRTETGGFRLVPLSPAHEALRLKTRPFTFDEVDLHSIGDASDRARARDLLAAPIPNEDLLRRLRSDRLHDEVLAAALCSAQVRPTRALAARLNTKAWEVVMRRGAGEAAYAEALQRAESAHALEPNDDSITNTLGVAQLRMGRYREALQTLEAAAAQNRPRGLGPRAWDLVPMAIARFHLGDRAAAIRLLEEAMSGRVTLTDDIAQDLEEARTLLGLGALSRPESR